MWQQLKPVTARPPPLHVLLRQHLVAGAPLGIHGAGELEPVAVDVLVRALLGELSRISSHGENGGPTRGVREDVEGRGAAAPQGRIAGMPA